MVSEWSAGFEAFAGRFAGRFPRVESRRQMVACLRGLLGEAERKNGWTLAEAADAGAAHVQSDHFKTAMEWLPDVVASTPEIINVEIPGAQGWSHMAEVTPRS